VVIFPEGTRYNPDDGKRISKSREVARDTSMQVLDYHLTPRSRGAWLVMNTMGDKLEAIYDITVGYSGAECGKGSFDTDRNKVPQLKGEKELRIFCYQSAKFLDEKQKLHKSCF
jgi:hypothetical protein